MPNNKVRIDRGISLDLWNARPYVPWTPEHLGPVNKEYATLPTPPQRAFMTRLAKQSPGWLIMRHEVPGWPKVYAEIRPDRKVQTGPPIRHWHGPQEEAPEEAFEPGVSILEYGSWAWSEHCRRINADKADDEPDHMTVDWVHEHKDEAKYVFPTSERVDDPWSHTHDLWERCKATEPRTSIKGDRYVKTKAGG